MVKIYREKDSLGFLIHRADMLLKNSFHSKIKSFNITREQWSILSWLYDCDGINQKELAEKIFKDPAALAKTLDRMQKIDLIKRVKDESDKRAYLLYLTEKGKEIKENIEPLAIETLNETFMDFTDNELQNFKKSLLKLLK